MGRSLTASILFHLALAGLLIGLSALSRPLPMPESPITVEIVTATTEPPQPSPLPPAAPPARTAPLPPRQAASPAPPPPPPPAPKAEPKPEPPPPPPPPPPKAVEPAPAPPPPPPPPQKKAEPKPEPAPEPPPPPPKPAPAKPPEQPAPDKPAPAPRAEPKPDKPADVAKVEPRAEKPPTPPAPKQQESDFDALLRSVEQTPKRVQAPEQRDGKGAATVAGGTGQPGKPAAVQVNPAVLAGTISRQITPCWNIPVAAQGIGGLRAELNIVMGPDGGVQSVVPMDAARMTTDPVFRAFAESAVRAVRACSPLKLPPESYQVWRNIIFNFDPSQLAG